MHVRVLHLFVFVFVRKLFVVCVLCSCKRVFSLFVRAMRERVCVSYSLFLYFLGGRESVERREQDIREEKTKKHVPFVI